GHGSRVGIAVPQRVLVGGSDPGAAGGWGSSHAFVAPRVVAEMANMRSIVAGEFLFGAVDDAGAVHTWGFNEEGALGRPTAHVNSGPGMIASLPPIAQLALGKGYMLARTEDDRLYGWGNNAAGQLGRGNLSSATV